MKLEQETSDRSWLPVLEAKFLVCARDTTNSGSAVMNALDVVTDEEKEIFNLGESKGPFFPISFSLDPQSICSEESKFIRHHEAQSSLINLPPNNEESLLIHEMFKQTIDLK